MPINSGYSFYEYAGDGVTTRFPVQFSLGELKRAYVTCRVDNEVDAFGAPLYRALADVPGDPGMIEVLGAVPGVGVPVVFRRIVPKELLLHLYANGSILDYPSLDESHLQLMMALHEVLDGYGLTNVFTDINMNGYKLTNVYSDPDDPNSIATVAFLGTYRQDALDAAIAAADSALEALWYRDTALGHANTAAAQVTLCQDQVQLAEGHADDAALSAIAADGSADAAEQSALGAIASVSGLGARVDVLEADLPALELIVADKLNKDENINLGVSVAASGTAVDFVGIPEGVKRVTVMFAGVSTNGSAGIKAVLGATSLDTNPTYNGNIMIITGTSLATMVQAGQTEFTLEALTGSRTTASTRFGKCVLEKLAGNTWIMSSRLAETGTAIGDMYVGSKTLADQLDRIRITTANGTDQFDMGTINISWEF